MEAGGKAEFAVGGVVPKPQLWEPGYPALYHVICTLRVAGKEVDTRETPLAFAP